MTFQDGADPQSVVSPSTSKLEVEKKFVLRPGDEEHISKWLHFLKQSVFTDIYYDDETFRLTSRDWWLRNRSGQWELKLPTAVPNCGQESGPRPVERYIELTSVPQLLAKLDIDFLTDDVAGCLANHGLHPFASITTSRRTYVTSPAEPRPIRVDIDTVDFGYQLLELEVLLDMPPIAASSSDSSSPSVSSSLADPAVEAIQTIESWTKKLGLSSSPVRGKVMEYLYRFRRDHYDALLKVFA